VRIAIILLGLLLLLQHEVRANCPRLEPDTLRWIGKPWSNQHLGAHENSVYAQSGIGIAAVSIDGLKQFVQVDFPNHFGKSRGEHTEHLNVVFFIHGWVPQSSRKLYQMGMEPTSYYASVIRSLADAGFIVISPFLRGHGFSDTEQADPSDHVNDLNLQAGYGRDALALWLNRKRVVQWLMKNVSAIPSQSIQMSLFGHSTGARAIAELLFSPCLEAAQSKVPVVLWGGSYTGVYQSAHKADTRFVVWLAHGDRDRFIHVADQLRFHELLSNQHVEAYYERLEGRNHEFNTAQTNQLAGDQADAALAILLRRTASFLGDARYKP
jgi:dienelactone hydrolase